MSIIENQLEESVLALQTILDNATDDILKSLTPLAQVDLAQISYLTDCIQRKAESMKPVMPKLKHDPKKQPGPKTVKRKVKK